MENLSIIASALNLKAHKVGNQYQLVNQAGVGQVRTDNLKDLAEALARLIKARTV